MSKKEAFEFTTNIIGSITANDLFVVLLKLYASYKYDEYQTTLTFSEDKYCYIYQYPCYVIRADRRHQDSLSSYNKNMIRRMNTDNKHKNVTVPLLQTDSKQLITCHAPQYPSDYDFHVYCRPDYEVTVTGDASHLEELYLSHIEMMGDINLCPVNDSMVVEIWYTHLHGSMGLTKPWMALIQSLRMAWCKLEADDISAMADKIQACKSPTEGESAFPTLQKLDLRGNSLTGAGADIARIISCVPICTEFNMGRCELEVGYISAIAGSIQACSIPTRDDLESPCRLQRLVLSTNRLTGAGADIARIVKCIPLCKWMNLDECGLNDEDFHAIVNAVIQTRSDGHTSEHDHSTSQTSRIKPASPGPASHIEGLELSDNRLTDLQTVRLLFDNLPPSLEMLNLSGNQFNKEETQEIRRTYKDKHPNLILVI